MSTRCPHGMFRRPVLQPRSGRGAASTLRILILKTRVRIGVEDARGGTDRSPLASERRSAERGRSGRLTS